MSKTWRLNVIIMYRENANIDNYRPPLLEFFRHIAWMFSLDYSIMEDIPLSALNDSEEIVIDNCKQDLIYFRSNDRTRIVAKDLRKAIDGIACKSILYDYRIDVGYMLSKCLSKMHFPKKFYRPLNYPFVESHDEGKVTVCVPLKSYLEVRDQDADFLLNYS